MRYIMAPDTTYESGLWHVFDTQEKNELGEQKCVLSYAQEAVAEKERDRLNGLEIAKAVLTKMVDPTAQVNLPEGVQVHILYGNRNLSEEVCHDEE